VVGIPFDFEVPVSFFEKADAGAGKQRRIGGIISTEKADRQGEVLLQRGLDFDSSFLRDGWFNDNHSKKTTDILGYPEAVQQFRKGDILPDGNKSPTNATWVEGYLLDTPAADEVWSLGKALQKTQRRLGFSVEGKVERRTGPKTVFLKSADGKDGKWVGRNVAKAIVRNVAITNCPVNADSRLEILTKSLAAVEESDPDGIEKTLTMGTATPGVAVAGTGSYTGEGAGKVLATQSLEGYDEKKKKKARMRRTIEKSLTDGEAVSWVQSRLNATVEQAGRFIELTKRLKSEGKL